MPKPVGGGRSNNDGLGVDHFAHGLFYRVFNGTAGATNLLLNRTWVPPLLLALQAGSQPQHLPS
jgi:hypothetical protein